MKHLTYLLIPAIVFASCGGGNKAGNDGDLEKLKKEQLSDTFLLIYRLIQLNTNEK